MSQIDYSLMSEAELRQFFLQNRQDQTAFEAYMDRLNQRPRKIIASPGDPDFEQKIQAAIRRKLEGSDNNSLSSNAVKQTG
jgi:predicted metal-dependent RNase